MNEPKIDLAVRPGEIPMPPQEMLEELDNWSNAEHSTGTSTPSASAKPTTKLAFTGGKTWTKDVPLDFPFEWDGREVTSITVRRLTTAEMGEVVGRASGDFDQWDVFAAMTGLPADVLRGLEAGDGDAVTGVAWDFLPRSLRKSD